MLSDSKPSGLRIAYVQMLARSLPVAPVAASAFTYQKAQIVKAVSGVPKSST